MQSGLIRKTETGERAFNDGGGGGETGLGKKLGLLPGPERSKRESESGEDSRTFQNSEVESRGRSKDGKKKKGVRWKGVSTPLFLSWEKGT